MRHTMFTNLRCDILKMSILLKMILRFHVTPIESLEEIFVDIKISYSKIYMERRRP